MSESTSPSPRSEFLKGARAELPILLGVMPFAMIYGVLARAAGLDPLAALLMSSIVFAGSAQFIITQLIATGTPPLLIVLTATIVNIRHMLYSASLARYVKPLSTPWRVGLAYLLTDEAYAVAIAHYLETDAAPELNRNRHWYHLGAGLTLWTCWQFSTALGVFLGAQIPPSWGLEFTLALTFIALTIPALKDRPSVAAAVAAGVVAVLAYNLPFKLGLMAAALTGIAIGMALESRARSRSSTALAEAEIDSEAG